jgi:hypothetical protein
VLAAAFCVLSLPSPTHGKDYSLSSRDIGCAEIAQGRSRQICEAISASLTWQWTGHATIAPGYKPSIEGIRKVYCGLNIGEEDVGGLQFLKTYDPSKTSIT